MAAPSNAEIPDWIKRAVRKLSPLLKLGSFEVHHDTTGKAVKLKVVLHMDERAAREAELLT